MRRFVAIVVVGCGRVSFDATDALSTDALSCDGVADHDDDDDGLEDDCDPCPDLAGDLADADRDGVGDACDPHPSVTGDQRTIFDPCFALDARWSPYGSPWQPLGDELAVSSLADSSGLRYSVDASRRWFAFAGETKSVGTGDPQVSLQLAEAGGPNWYCEVYTSNGEFKIRNNQTGPNLAYQNIGAFPLGRWHIAFGIVDGAARCVFHDGATRYELSAPLSIGMTSEIFLGLVNVAVRVDRFSEVTSP